MNSVSLNKLEQSLSKKNITKAIAYLIKRLSESFNVGKKFNDQQAALLAFDLTDVFGYETLEDVVLMFKLARQGRIGDGKDYKLDGQTILHKWVPEYLELKAEEREKQHNDNKEASKIYDLKEINPDVAKKMFEGVGKAEIKTDSKNGLGTRAKEKLQKAKVITNRTDYLFKMRLEARKASDERLKNYLLKNDSKSENFDSQLYEIIENELDNRSKK